MDIDVMELYSWSKADLIQLAQTRLKWGKSLEKQLAESVPFDEIQKIVDEIKAEIRRMGSHPSIGKKGCVIRLERLRPIVIKPTTGEGV